MTDRTIPDVTNDDRSLARKWAERIIDTPHMSHPVETAAARVVLHAVPAPKSPTMADMSPEERVACKWMQADVAGRDTHYVIARPYDKDYNAVLISADGGVVYADPARVTPRPDLPRLEWPGDKPAHAPALPDGWRLADHPDYGRVIVTNTTPDPSGHVYFVGPADDSMGCDRFFCDPARLTYLDGPETPAPAPVPSSTLDVGSEWDDTDALARACRESGRDQITVIDCDGDVSVWNGIAGWWQTGTPSDGHEPYTILHPGKKADQ